MISDVMELAKMRDYQGIMTWGGSRGGSGGSVEPPKLNVKTYNKRVVKKKVNQIS